MLKFTGTKKEFALSAIKPYYEDPTICGYDGLTCIYETEDGRNCVLGRYLISPRETNNRRAKHILMRNQDVIVPPYRNILSAIEWDDLQTIHDSIAKGVTEQEIENRVKELGLFTYEELITD